MNKYKLLSIIILSGIFFSYISTVSPADFINRNWKILFISTDISPRSNIYKNNIIIRFEPDTMKIITSGKVLRYNWNYNSSNNAIQSKISGGTSKDTMSYFIQSLQPDTLSLYYYQFVNSSISGQRINCVLIRE